MDNFDSFVTSLGKASCSAEETAFIFCYEGQEKEILSVIKIANFWTASVSGLDSH